MQTRFTSDTFTHRQLHQNTRLHGYEACNGQIDRSHAGLWWGVDVKRLAMTRAGLMVSAGTVRDGCSDDWRLQMGCFHKACEGGHVEMAKYLIEVGGTELLMPIDRVSAMARCLSRAIPVSCTFVCLCVCISHTNTHTQARTNTHSQR